LARRHGRSKLDDWSSCVNRRTTAAISAAIAALSERGAVLGTAGSDFRVRRAGTYRVGCIADYDSAVRIGPDILRDVDRRAVTVSLADGDKKTVKVCNWR